MLCMYIINTRHQHLKKIFTVYFLQPNYAMIAKNCNLWRNYRDISDSWDSVLDIINHYGEHQGEFQPFAGPGNWNDPDMVRGRQ